MGVLISRGNTSGYVDVLKPETQKQIKKIFQPGGRTNDLHAEMLEPVILTLPAFHLFVNGTMTILNKKPMAIHNEWAQPNSFPWCEIVLSVRNHWWLPNDKKHPHAFLIDSSCSWEPGNVFTPLNIPV